MPIPTQPNFVGQDGLKKVTVLLLKVSLSTLTTDAVLNSLPHPIPEDQLDQEKASAICNGEYLNYARWKGGYVEVLNALYT